jgi:hypothetical protein
MDMKLCLQDTNNLGIPFINRSKASTIHAQCNFMRMVGDVNRQIDSHKYGLQNQTAVPLYLDRENDEQKQEQKCFCRT